MAEKDCENFNGGFCKTIKKHVPLAWCATRCKGEPEKLKERRQENIKDVKPPSVFEMAKSFALAIKYIVLHKGKPTVGQDVYEYRYMECWLCMKNDQVTRCPECGCLLKAKMILASEQCPRGRWDLLLSENSEPGEVDQACNNI